MRPVSQTPTEASDYALLSTTYAALLAGTAVSARRRDPIPAAEIPALAAATFTLSKLIVHEKVETWIRQPFVEERPGGGKRPRGRRLRYAVGELLTCTRCTGAWTALALVGLRLHAPATARTVNTMLATSAGNDFLHAGFTWLCARATAQEREAERAGPAGRRRAAGRLAAASTSASAASRSSASVNSSAVRVRSSTRRTAGVIPASTSRVLVARQLGAGAQELLEHRRVDERGAREVEDDAAAAGRLVDVRAHRRGRGDVELAGELEQRDAVRGGAGLDGERARGLDARALDLRFVQPVALVHPRRARLLGGHGDNVARRPTPAAGDHVMLRTTMAEHPMGLKAGPAARLGAVRAWVLPPC